MSGKVYVLDTAALIYLRRYPGDNVTTPSAVEEVKRSDERLMVDALVSAELIRLVEPPERYLEEARSLATETGDIHVLSGTDLEILALSLYLRDSGRDVVVVTDDYAIQNVLRRAGVPYQAVTRSIKRSLRWVYVCSKCGRRYSAREKPDTCVVCGGEIRRVRRK